MPGLFESTLGAATAIFGGPVCGPSPESRARSLYRDINASARALLWGHQVHGSTIASFSDEHHDEITQAHCVGRCDGIMTDVHGVALTVWTADCVPVMLAGGGVIAAVHAGWRGCAQGIVTRAVRRMWSEYKVPADLIEVRLGPSIGPCHYQVGDEVIRALGDTEVAESDFIQSENHIDLRSFLGSQLRSAGVRGTKIVNAGGCTYCDHQMASYRRDGVDAGRQYSLILLS